MSMRRKKDNNLLDYVPCRNPKLEWSQQEDGTVVLHRKNTGFYNRLAQRLFHRPVVSHIELEKYGSFLWIQINGKDDIQMIATRLKDEFGDEVEPLYPRLGQYMRVLKNNHFIQMRKGEKSERV